MLLVQMVTEPAPEPKGDDPTPTPQPPKKITLKVPKKVMGATEYRELLMGQFRQIGSLPDDAKVEVTIEHK
ncbi:MAG TPA: hypothetical protein DD671_08280 [Balneolaceae bacterium]|nr:hypothetical protein [Balneolaceae bacterium]